MKSSNRNGNSTAVQARNVTSVMLRNWQQNEKKDLRMLSPVLSTSTPINTGSLHISYTRTHIFL